MGILKDVERFLYVILASVIFVTIGMPYLYSEYTNVKGVESRSTEVTQQFFGENTTKDLSYIAGDDVLGMVPFALNGDYVLVLDGITIDENTDPDYVNFSGVAGREYRIQVGKNADGKQMILANVR